MPPEVRRFEHNPSGCGAQPVDRFGRQHERRWLLVEIRARCRIPDPDRPKTTTIWCWSPAQVSATTFHHVKTVLPERLRITS